MMVTMTTPAEVITPTPAIPRVVTIRAATVAPMGPAPMGLLISQGIANDPGSHHRKGRPPWSKNVYRLA